MQGIDAPETDQPMSDDAVALRRRLLGDGEIELQPAGQRSYTRTIARVYVGGTDVNAEMIRRGLAMAERRFLRGLMTARATACSSTRLERSGSGSGGCCRTSASLLGSGGRQ
jgi:micrococcal nuclease